MRRRCRADIGIAMGGAGTDIAMEAADVVIMNDDLRRIPETIRLSRRTHAVLWQNITLALGIKAVFLVLAVFGSATMWMAVFADMGAACWSWPMACGCCMPVRILALIAIESWSTGDAPPVLSSRVQCGSIPRVKAECQD